MEQFLQQVVNGLSLGSIYALIALGYTMVYGIIKLINFAHCDVYMIGAYVGYACMTFLHLGFVASLCISMLVCMVLGVIIEKVAYKPLRNAARIAVLITAIGVSYLLEYGMMYFVKANVRTYPEKTGILAMTFQLGNINISMLQILIVAITVVLMIALQLIVKKTRIGKAMRATSQDQDAAELMGINVNTTISFTFALGSALAGAAGVLVGISLQFHRSSDGIPARTEGLRRCSVRRDWNYPRRYDRWLLYRYCGNLRFPVTAVPCTRTPSYLPF